MMQTPTKQCVTIGCLCEEDRCLGNSYELETDLSREKGSGEVRNPEVDHDDEISPERTEVIQFRGRRSERKMRH